ncbi:MAG: hypothetical protein ACXWID_17660 [Pyrinomonadaceae bacterium]
MPLLVNDGNEIEIPAWSAVALLTDKVAETVNGWFTCTLVADTLRVVRVAVGVAVQPLGFTAPLSIAPVLVSFVLASVIAGQNKWRTCTWRITEELLL